MMSNFQEEEVNLTNWMRDSSLSHMKINQICIPGTILRSFNNKENRIKDFLKLGLRYFSVNLIFDFKKEVQGVTEFMNIVCEFLQLNKSEALILDLSGIVNTRETWFSLSKIFFNYKNYIYNVFPLNEANRNSDKKEKAKENLEFIDTQSSDYFPEFTLLKGKLFIIIEDKKVFNIHSTDDSEPLKMFYFSKKINSGFDTRSSKPTYFFFIDKFKNHYQLNYVYNKSKSNYFVIIKLDYCFSKKSYVENSIEYEAIHKNIVNFDELPNITNKNYIGIVIINIFDKALIRDIIKRNFYMYVSKNIDKIYNNNTVDINLGYLHNNYINYNKINSSDTNTPYKNDENDVYIKYNNLASYTKNVNSSNSNVNVKNNENQLLSNNSFNKMNLNDVHKKFNFKESIKNISNLSNLSDLCDLSNINQTDKYKNNSSKTTSNIDGNEKSNDFNIIKRHSKFNINNKNTMSSINIDERGDKKSQAKKDYLDKKENKEDSHNSSIEEL